MATFLSPGQILSSAALRSSVSKAAANSIIDKNKVKLDKVVWTANDNGTKIKVHRSVTDGEEGRFVAGTIFEQKMQNQLPWR